MEVLRLIHPFWSPGSCSAFACGTRARRSSLVRTVQVASVLSAKTCVSISCPSCQGSPCWCFGSSAVGAPHSSALAGPPRPSQAPTTLGGNKSRALLNLGAAVGTSTGEQRGLCAKMCCHRYPKSIPVPSVPGGPGTPWVALLVSHPPNSLENHQFLSKMCSLGPRGNGRSCASAGGAALLGEEKGAW